LQRELAAAIGEYMVYGGYPRVVLAESREQKQEILRDLIVSYTRKDILESGIRNQENIMQLMRVLSDQTGHTKQSQDRRMKDRKMHSLVSDGL